MPRVIIQEEVPGWGCSCPAQKVVDIPPPDQWATFVMMADRAALVEVSRLPDGPTGTLHFIAWTDPERQYSVVRAEKGNGWCKHSLACAAMLDPILAALIQGIHASLEYMKEKDKEIKKLGKELERCQKKQ